MKNGGEFKLGIFKESWAAGTGVFANMFSRLILYFNPGQKQTPLNLNIKYLTPRTILKYPAVHL